MLIDLTFEFPETEEGRSTLALEERHICWGSDDYIAQVYSFSYGSMVGSYIDFPGHIRRTDDGMHAANYPIDKLYRIKSTVIHLDRESESGMVTAEELRAACPIPIDGGALILNALGTRRHDAIKERSVYLHTDAVEWITEIGVHLLVSDVYESNDDPQGVFQSLFGAGISTVCCPVNMQRLTQPTVMLTVLSLPIPGVTQLPCRIIAEMD